MAKSKRVALAPVLQTIRDYLANHYMDEMLQEITANMRLGNVEGFDVDCSQGEIIVDPEKTTLMRVEMWRLDRTHALADCKMRIKFGISKDGRIPRYVIRYINFSANVTLDGGITLEQGFRELTTFSLPARGMIALTKYMVPVLTNDEMELLVLDMLQQYLGKEALHDRPNSSERLAQAMGLTIMHAPLFQSGRTASILFLKEKTVRVCAGGVLGPGTNDADYEEIIVPARTILINDNRERTGDVDKAIYHECGHFEWHSMFYELQETHASDLKLLDYQEADTASAPAEKDIRMIERQANFVGLAAMFPRPVFTPLTQKHWREVMNDGTNLGKKIASVIFRIANETQKPKSCIKTRMIQLGSIAARGANNWVDGDYIEDFAFDPENLESGETFVISRSQFTELYEENAAFREIIDSHCFVYADGHVCVNQSRYVRKAEKGFMLTEHGLAHADECCMKFTRTYHFYTKGYAVGELHSDDDYNGCYLMIHSFDIAGMNMDELLERNVEYLDKLPRRPSKALTKLIKDRVKTQKALAAASGLSETRISHMCNEDTFRYTIQDVTRIVIGLELPPPLSALFLEMTGFTRAVMISYYQYQCIIDCLFMEDIETVEKTHANLFNESQSE